MCNSSEMFFREKPSFCELGSHGYDFDYKSMHVSMLIALYQFLNDTAFIVSPLAINSYLCLF